MRMRKPKPRNQKETYIMCNTDTITGIDASLSSHPTLYMSSPTQYLSLQPHAPYPRPILTFKDLIIKHGKDINDEEKKRKKKTDKYKQ